MATKTKITTEFTIELPITSKDLKDIVDAAVQEFTDGFAYQDKDVRKQVDALKKTLFLDGKFRAMVADTLVKQGKDWIQAELDYGDTDFTRHPLITQMRKDIRKVEDREYQKYSEEMDVIRIKAAIKLLKDKGFRVTEGA